MQDDQDAIRFASVVSAARHTTQTQGHARGRTASSFAGHPRKERDGRSHCHTRGAALRQMRPR